MQNRFNVLEIIATIFFILNSVNKASIVKNVKQKPSIINEIAKKRVLLYSVMFFN